MSNPITGVRSRAGRKAFGGLFGQFAIAVLLGLAFEVAWDAAASWNEFTAEVASAYAD